MESYSKEELMEFKKLIQKKIADAQDEYDSLIKQLEDNSTKDTDPVWLNANYVTENSSMEEIILSAARQKRFINSLSDALDRIQNGTYGICVQTGKLIPKGRLMAVPHTTLCIDKKIEAI